MGPVLEDRPVPLVQKAQRLRPVGLPPRPEDHVVRPLDGVDAVDLDEAEPADQGQQVRAPRGAGRRFRQSVAIEEDAPGVAVADPRVVHRSEPRCSESLRASSGIFEGIQTP